MFSTEFAYVIEAAFRDAKERGHAYFCVEHLLFSLLHDQDVIHFLDNQEVDIEELEDGLRDFLSTSVEISSTNQEPEQTPAIQRVLHRAVQHARSEGRAKASGMDALQEILNESESYAAYYLHENGLMKYNVSISYPFSEKIMTFLLKKTTTFLGNTMYESSFENIKNSRILINFNLKKIKIKVFRELALFAFLAPPILSMGYFFGNMNNPVAIYDLVFSTGMLILVSVLVFEATQSLTVLSTGLSTSLFLQWFGCGDILGPFRTMVQMIPTQDLFYQVKTASILIALILTIWKSLRLKLRFNSVN
jgi:hypothetical protein